MQIAEAEGVFQPFPGTDAQTFIQWKGTEVCMDIYCPCDPNEPRHVDAAFAYFVRCDNCGAVYEVGTQVKLRRLAEGEEPTGHPVETDSSD